MKKELSSDEFRKYKEENTIPVAYRGWGSPKVRAWIIQKSFFEQVIPEDQVIWKTECVSDQMWTPGTHDIYKVFFAEPGVYDSQKAARANGYQSCHVEYAAVRRESPVPDLPEYEKLLTDFRPYLSHRRYQELLQELEGKTPEEKEQVLIEEMEELTAVMSYY